jgi:ATP-dependent exoDNAse (exonuclease V) beta subunit
LNKKTYQDDSSLEKKQFTIREVNYPSLEEESVEHASKKLKLGTSKKSLEFGTTLHEILEIVSFQNPDLSFIKNEKIRNIITNFLSCPLLEHVKEGQVYKEFEFSDATHHGIIDLMIVYFDHIDIIDYKTKNILDESYDEQVKFYKDYIATLSNKEIHLYIYSLLEGKYRQVA